MSEPLILHLETATNICSVALSRGSELLALRETDEDRSHGTVLTRFMDEVMQEAGKKPTDIEAIAISKGPGSYTGLRIGVSAAKGFAFAGNIPVIGIITLRSLALAALEQPSARKITGTTPGALLCPMIDARRMEVFTALYDQEICEIDPVSAVILDENSFRERLEKEKILFFGNGAVKAEGVINHPNAVFIGGVVPSARFMIPLALAHFRKQHFEDTAYFEPYYLKDFIATIPRRKVL